MWFLGKKKHPIKTCGAIKYLGIHHATNRRMGGGSTRNSVTFSYISLCYVINTEILNRAGSFDGVIFLPSNHTHHANRFYRDDSYPGKYTALSVVGPEPRRVLFCVLEYSTTHQRRIPGKLDIHTRSVENVYVD